MLILANLHLDILLHILSQCHLTDVLRLEAVSPPLVFTLGIDG